MSKKASQPPNKPEPIDLRTPSADLKADDKPEQPGPKKSRKKLIVILFIAFVLLTLAAGLLLWYLQPWKNLAGVKSPVVIKQESTNTTPVPTKTEVVVENLTVPWSIVFTGGDRMLVTERSGGVRVVEKGNLQSKPLVTFSEVSSEAEEGLMGMALDPNYGQNKFVYVCLAYSANGQLKDKVVRFKDNSNSTSDTTTILDNIPAAEFHAGCKLKLSPDGKLFITTGDATNKAQAQDKNSLAGKILRVNADGSIPADNPFGNSPVWSYGHRNPQGICWQPGTDQLYSVEHGPSGNDGPGGGDEVNIIHKGENYGWPLVSHEAKREGTVAPLLVFTPAVAPGACSFYGSDVLPQFTGNMFFTALRGEGLYRIEFSKENPTQITKYEKMPGIEYGRLREVIESPDGAIYFSTSNRDGRGQPQAGDDKIYKIVPAK